MIIFSGQDAISGKGDLRGAAVDAKRYQPPQILPNGPTASPPNLDSSGNVGRRPMIPHFDMDANEIMKVKSSAQLVERLLPAPEICGSIPVISKVYLRWAGALV